MQWEIVILEGRIRLLATKPDGIQVLLCDWFTPNATATMSGLLPHFGTMHAVAAGSASPASDNFVLYDNLKVESIVAGSPLDANHWCRY